MAKGCGVEGSGSVNGRGGAPGSNAKPRRRRRQKDAAYSSDEDESEEEETEWDGEEAEEVKPFVIPKAEPGGSVPVAVAASLARWPCPACTFANPGDLDRCELCETPKPEITPTQAAAADDEIEFVREIKVTSNRRVRRSSGNATGSAPAPKPKRPRTARVKREPGTAAVTTAAVAYYRGGAPAAPRRAGRGEERAARGGGGGGWGTERQRVRL